MSAEAAGAAFERIKLHASEKSEAGAKKCKIILATVHGDIHDIGKNIVKLLLENYGYEVIDLGKDVPPEKVAEAAEKHSVPLVGLSALMTTTVPAMERTIALLREKAPNTKIMVGGAVLTKDYAQKIGADGYAKDAMSAVKLTAELLAKQQ
jgi:5-methyltetrahydrofolate--homocysteine methyltransferase